MTQERTSEGRWRKGVSGNPKGRPTNVSKTDFGDWQVFRNTVVPVETPRGRQFLTREAAIQQRLYASAMKGNVHAQIFLLKTFAADDEQKTDLEVRFLNLREELKREKPPWDDDRWDLQADLAIALGYVKRPDHKEKGRRSRAKNPEPDPNPAMPKRPSFMKDPSQ